MPLSEQTRLGRSELLLLVLVVTVGALLRIFALEVSSMWNDELSSIYFVSFPSLHDSILIGVGQDSHPPLYYILLYWAKILFGESDASFRIPSLITGVLWIPVMWWLGRRWFGQRTGIAAAVVSALFWAPIDISLEVRNYSLAIFTLTLSMAGWEATVRPLVEGKKPGVVAYLVFLLASIAACYSHYIALMAVVLQAGATAILFWKKRVNLLWILWLYLPLPIAYLPWMGQILHDMFGGGTSDLISWMPTPSFREMAKIVVHDFGRFLPLVFAAVGVYGWAAIKFILPSIQGGGEKRPVPLPGWGVTVSFLWIALPITLALVRSWMSDPMLHYRPMLITLPAIYLLFARSLDYVAGSRTLFVSLLAGVVLLALVDLFAVKQYYTRNQREDFRGVAQMATSQTVSGTDAMVVSAAYEEEFFDHYFRLFGSDLRTEATFVPNRISTDSLKIYLSMEESLPDSLWLLEGHIHWRDEQVAELNQLGYKVVQDSSFYMARGRLLVLHSLAE